MRSSGRMKGESHGQKAAKKKKKQIKGERELSKRGEKKFKECASGLEAKF